MWDERLYGMRGCVGQEGVCDERVCETRGCMG